MMILYGEGGYTVTEGFFTAVIFFLAAGPGFPESVLSVKADIDPGRQIKQTSDNAEAILFITIRYLSNAVPESKLYR